MQNIRVELEDLSAVKKKLDISVPAETVRKEISAAYQSLRSNASIAGFRKGAAPLNILKARFGSDIQEDVTKRLIESTYPQALGEKKLIPVEAPKVELKADKAREDQDFSYSVTFEVQPRVEIDGYMGMELKKEDVTVTDQDIDTGIENLRQASAQFKDVERPAKEGDLVVVDFEAFIGGEPIKNGKGADYPCIIGERTMLPGFDEALKGATKGPKEIDLNFPENYSEATIAGKTGHFKLTVKAVKEKSVPDLTEDFAKDVGCENLDALRAKVKEEIERHKSNEAKERLKNDILTMLIDKHQFEVPQALVNRYMGIILNRIIDNMRMGSFAPEDKGLNVDQLKEKYTPAAVRSVKEDIVLDYIAAKEKVDASEQDVESAVRNIAAQRQVSYESLMARIEKEGALEVIKDGLKHEKVFDIIIGSSKTAA
ncbi:MAG TPA: trigger factor [Deltaproteobacteria bacterium]|nr:MAG: trigger factor [Deltaproteobacteria bacterium GWA2_55_82]OIJ73357.1 MAG: trigger factor [Deltaproteobacteria bacterium GWC2_55_46]HBG45367.1 trigger factor [Deltaproteobacteria bacterium]HCY10198.1 trigger factor [Deltaproteobacteria bacterium]